MGVTLGGGAGQGKVGEDCMVHRETNHSSSEQEWGPAHARFVGEEVERPGLRCPHLSYNPSPRPLLTVGLQ